MARCCGSGCSCKVVAGAHVTVTGIGSMEDPFVISTDNALSVLDGDVIDLNVAGSGTELDPWVLSAGYAPTAQLGDIPDVNVVGVTNGQVLGWSTSTGRWTPRAPTTAASGSVLHDTSMTGDGSSGNPLQIVEDPNGGLTTTGAGLGLTSATKNTLVRQFGSDAARAAASPAPVINSLSSVSSRPGQVDYWTGSQWLPTKSQVSVSGTNQELLRLSGGYVSGGAVEMVVKMFTGITSAEGVVVALDTAALSGRAGVLTAHVEPLGAQPYFPMVSAGAADIRVLARRVDTGAVLVGQAISGQLVAYVY